MSEMVERSSLNLRYESCRLRSDAAEAPLLASITVPRNPNGDVMFI